MNKECTYCKKLFHPDEYRNIGLKPGDEVGICPTCIMQTCAGRLSRVQIIQNSLSLLKILYHCFDFSDVEDVYQELEVIISKLNTIQNNLKDVDRYKR